ncbi:MAG TPA: hypothetical protein ENO20_07705 [Bacteroides sp.]|nr:hypothetical protein [Bacteroides sp.]
MKCIIHNEKSIISEHERLKARAIVDRQIERMGKITRNYPKTVVADLYFNAADKNNYIVSAVVNLKGEMVYIKEKGPNVESLLHALFDRMRLTVSKKIHKERKAFLYKRKNQQYESFMDHLAELQELRREEDKTIFNQLLKIILDDVSGYMRRRIKSAEMTTAIRRGKFKIQELLDELYVRIYDKFDQIPAGEQQIRTWLYYLADEILEEKFRELEFEETHFEQLDKLVDAEYRSLEESFTVDAENEIIPLEEIDGYEEMTDMYSAEDLIYGEDENSFLDEITLRINQEEIHALIEKELAKLPVFKRTIMDLYLVNQMTVQEIAGIKQISDTEVEAVIREVNTGLKRKLSFLL